MNALIATILVVVGIVPTNQSEYVRDGKRVFDTRVTVFVAAPTRDGFVETSKAIDDSVRDVRAKLSRMRELRVVDTPEAAEVIVTVVARGIGSQEFGQRLHYAEYSGGAVLSALPVVSNTYWVSAVLSVPGYRKEITGAYTHPYAGSLGAWGDCASQIARDVKTWIASNTKQIRARKAG